jgi:uncharacterized protein (DUF58 family)
VNVTPKAYALILTIFALSAASLALRNPGAVIATIAGLSTLAGAMLGLAEKYEATLSSLQVSREPRHIRVTEGTPVEVRLSIANPTGQALPSIVARDEPPPRARASRPLGSGVLEAYSRAEIRYTARPAPGLIRVRSVRLEARDPLGLYSVSRRFEAVSTIQAQPAPYPSLEEKPSLGLGTAEALYARRRGWGTEFYSLRDYMPGDDVRLIAWLPSARAGRLVVRENIEPRRLDICLVADLSLESWAGTPGQTPADWAMRASLGLSAAALRSRGLLGFAVFLGEASLRRDPSRAPDVAPSLLEALSVASPEHARRRIGLSRLLEDALEWPSSCTLVLLLGPGALEAIRDDLAGRAGWRSVVAVIHPMGDGLLDRALREAYRAIDEPLVDKLRASGVQAFIASTPAGLAAGLEAGVLEVAGRLARAP